MNNTAELALGVNGKVEKVLILLAVLGCNVAKAILLSIIMFEPKLSERAKSDEGFVSVIGWIMLPILLFSLQSRGLQLTITSGPDMIVSEVIL